MIGAEDMGAVFAPTADAAWVIEQPGFDPLRDCSRQSRFAISNGFLGVRGGRTVNRGLECGSVPHTYVAGLFDVPGSGQPVPGLVPAADWLRVDISLAPGPSGPGFAEVSHHHRMLDLRRGLLVTSGRLAGPAGVAIRFQVLRLVSLSARACGLQLLRLEVEAGDCEIDCACAFDGLDFGLTPERLDPALGVWRTRSTGKRLAMASAHVLEVDGVEMPARETGPLAASWRWRARPGQIVGFARFVAVIRSDDPADDPGPAACRERDGARLLGWRGVLDAHVRCWASRWQCSDVTVGGDPGAQRALRFAAYHLIGAANPADERVSIAARALTGPDYRGHVFWDTEIHLLPFYCLTWPEAARALLMYRFHTLDAAREKARGMGWRGAMYAWESADTGAEATPAQIIGPDRKVVNILCGLQEQHITADVAYAVWQYWLATGDGDFLRDAGAEILLEAGRFWSSRARREADGLHHIRNVIGPDEYHVGVDDSAFTNVMARWTIRRAIEVAELMARRWPREWARLAARIGVDERELAQWSVVAEAMATGLDPRSGLFEQFAGYFALEDIDLAQYAGRSVPIDVVLGRERTERSQLIKQADVVALLALLPEEFPAGAGERNFAYYEPRCSHGSSLSKAMHGLVAARLGLSAMALGFFRANAAIDLSDNHAAIDGGVHIAALGGSWMMAVMGFAGLRLLADGLALDPRLPAEWASLAFHCQWRGRRIGIRIGSGGRSLEAVLESGPPMSLLVRGVAHPLGPGSTLHLDLTRPGTSASPAPEPAIATPPR